MVGSLLSGTTDHKLQLTETVCLHLCTPAVSAANQKHAAGHPLTAWAFHFNSDKTEPAASFQLDIKVTADNPHIYERYSRSG